MNPNRLNNGEQLKNAILEYANTKIVTYKNRFKLAITIYFLVNSIIAFIIYVNKFEWFNIMPSIMGVLLVLMYPTQSENFEYSGISIYKKVINLLDGSICYFNSNGDFPIIELFVTPKSLIDKNSSTEEMIRRIFSVLMPNQANSTSEIYLSIYAMPSINLTEENSIMNELEKIVDSDLDRNSSGLPFDIKTKGKEMSKAYFMLYCIENTLRLFIESEEKKMLKPLVIPSSVRNKISGRKANESQNKYISVRGTTDLFYMDFKELGDVIVNNQELISKFPNENWVRVKIDELGNIRNLIAHNSYIGEHELKIISTNYESILRQIRK